MKKLLVLSAIFSLVIAGCGGSSPDTPSTTEQSTTTTAAPVTTTATIPSPIATTTTAQATTTTQTVTSTTLPTIAPPVCALVQSSGWIFGTLTLNAVCAPAATSYAWSDNTGIDSSHASGVISVPTVSTSYSVIGYNAGGASAPVSLTISPPTTTVTVPASSTTTTAASTTTTSSTTTTTAAPGVSQCGTSANQLDSGILSSAIYSLNYQTQAGQNFRPSINRSQSITYQFTAFDDGHIGSFVTEYDGVAGQQVYEFLDISTTPCKFDYQDIPTNQNFATSNWCGQTASTANLRFMVRQAGVIPPPYICVLQPNTTYYLNIRNEEADAGVFGIDTCPANTQCGFVLNVH